jgi:twitching motility protein PilT
MSAGVRIESVQARDLEIEALLRYLVDNGGSDLHLSVGAPPLIRLNGEMKPIPGYSTLDEHTLKVGLYRILTEDQRNRYESEWELDLAYTIRDVSRFRVNIMRQRSYVGAVFRVIPSEIKPLETLGMPTVLYNLAALPRGLVLVTGPTGSGKSTTLASLIDRANRTRSGHIITIEDPIEFLHPHRSSVVNQREVGADTHSFAEALKHVLRQDPDIILIGELRDLETISVALTAAETGHLVFATLHTQSAQDTVNRIIDVFPPGQQQQIRSQLAATLRGVVCQTLVKRADAKGRAAASEIMIVTPAIATMIRRDETHQIHQALQSGAELGMQTLNQHLAELVVKGVIERETAEEVATDVKDLDALVQGKMGKKQRPNFSAPTASGLAGTSSL